MSCVVFITFIKYTPRAASPSTLESNCCHPASRSYSCIASGIALGQTSPAHPAARAASGTPRSTLGSTARCAAGEGTLGTPAVPRPPGVPRRAL